MATVKITQENFDELVLNSPKTVLLDFWAPWCMPCKMLSPILEQIAAEREDIIVGKVNVDEEIALAREFRIVSIPMLVVMKDGMAVETAVGYMPKEEIETLLA